MSVIKTQVLAFFRSTPHPLHPIKSSKTWLQTQRSFQEPSPKSAFHTTPLKFRILSTVETRGRASSEEKASGFHSLWRFPLIFDLIISKTSCPASGIQLSRCLLLVTWIKPGLPQRNTANPCKIRQCQGGLAKWENCKTFALHSPRKKSFRSKYASLFFTPQIV